MLDLCLFTFFICLFVSGVIARSILYIFVWKGKHFDEIDFEDNYFIPTVGSFAVEVR